MGFFEDANEILDAINGDSNPSRRMHDDDDEKPRDAEAEMDKWAIIKADKLLADLEIDPDDWEEGREKILKLMEKCYAKGVKHGSGLRSE